MEQGEAPTAAKDFSWREIFSLAWPVMLAYVGIGVPCGVMEHAVGFTPLMAFVVSVTFYSGAGQFIIPKMWLAGSPLMSIAMTVSFMNTRQVLYSTAFSPWVANEGFWTTFAFGATVTDESFGVNIERYREDPRWNARKGLAVNVCCMLSWAFSNALGCALGPVIDLPIAVLSFAMTGIFICLAVTREIDAATAVVMAATVISVVVLKLVGLGSVAVLLGATLGVLAGLGFKVMRERGESK